MIVGTAGLGKSVIMGELARRGCAPLTSRFNKMYPVNSNSSTNKKKMTTGTMVGAVIF